MPQLSVIKGAKVVNN